MVQYRSVSRMSGSWFAMVVANNISNGSGHDSGNVCSSSNCGSSSN